MNSEKKTVASLDAGVFTMSERLWAGLEKVAATKVYEDLNRPARQSLGTMVGLNKRIAEPLLNMGLIRATPYRYGEKRYEDITITPLGRRALATRGISYPVRYAEIGEVERVPNYMLAASVLRARAAGEDTD